MLRFEHTIKILCRVLKVNRSTYYKHFSGKIAPRTIENQDLRTKILTIYSSSKKRFGAHKIRQRLIAEYGIKISAGRVYRLMKSMQLPKMSTIKPKFIKHSADNRLPCDNILQQKFNPKAPNYAWVSDITYIKTANGFCYVCVIMDLFSRKVISWKISRKIDAKLVIDTFLSAYEFRGCPSGVLFHSDRGSQYTSASFRRQMDTVGFVQSFSAKGHPYDNAVVESFFKFLKLEEMDRRSFRSESDVNLALFEYIEGFYNPKRPHSANNFLSPDEKESDFFA